MFGKHFELNEQTMHIVKAIGRMMPGGFFIYRANETEELLYANAAVFSIFGCKDISEFKELTGYTFHGMVHPDDKAAVSGSIIEQIKKNEDNFDCVEYRIIRQDGEVRWVDDYGHYTETEAYGGIYYVFISDITKKHEQQELEKRLAFQEKLIEEQNQREQQDKMITALASDYRSVYHIDLDLNDGVCYRADPEDKEQTAEGVHFPY